MLTDTHANPNLPTGNWICPRPSSSPKSLHSQDSQMFLDQTQSQSQLESFLEPFRDELEKSWGYLEPLTRGLPCIYLYKTKERYVIGRKAPERLNVKRNAKEVRNEYRSRTKGDGKEIRIRMETKERKENVHANVNMAKLGRIKNDVSLEGKGISHNHCLITWDRKSSSATVRDLHSSNGTFINSTRILRGQSRVLRNGNVIRFGSGEHCVYTFHILSNPEKGFFAKYDVVRELGKGTFATVSLVLHRRTGRYYAVKVIRRTRMYEVNSMSKPGRITSNGFENITTLSSAYRKSALKSKSDRFICEISILSKLDHENICRLKRAYDVTDEDGGCFYLVLDYISGGDLMQKINSSNGLDEDLSKRITYQICLAMSYLHAQNIAHRDLKPENILLTESSPPIVKVADFGLAKALEDGSAFRTTCGTPHYQAPEIILRDRPDEGYTMLVDSYSVGVIVFCMLANSQPYSDDPKLTRKERVKARIFDWEPLRYKLGGDCTAETFISELVATNTAERLSLTQALEHNWLLLPSIEYGSNGRNRNISENPYANASPNSSIFDSQQSQPEMREQNSYQVQHGDVKQEQFIGVWQTLMSQECGDGVVSGVQFEANMATSESVGAAAMNVDVGVQSTGLIPARSLSYAFDIPGLFLSGQTASNIARSIENRKDDMTDKEEKVVDNGLPIIGEGGGLLKELVNNRGKRKERPTDDSDSDLDLNLYLKAKPEHSKSTRTDTAVFRNGHNIGIPSHGYKRSRPAPRSGASVITSDSGRRSVIAKGGEKVHKKDSLAKSLSSCSSTSRKETAQGRPAGRAVRPSVKPWRI